MDRAKQFIEKAIEGGWEPYRYHFIEAESIAEDEAAGPAPKPHHIEVSKEGHEDFECPHWSFVLFWDEESDPRVSWENNKLIFSVHSILLDPEAWKAVGKVEEWAHYETKDHFFYFIDAVWKGKTIEQYLETLFTP